MDTATLIEKLKGEKAFFEGMPDIKEVILYGSAHAEKEIASDIDLLIIPDREMSEAERVDVRQQVWEKLKDEMPVMLEVRTPKDDLTKEALTEKGVPMTSVYAK